MTDVYELGLLIKDIDNFDMDTFDGRLGFQKTIHLLQSFGIDLGYYYNWYLRGPYCPTLTKIGFELKGIIEKIPRLPIEFADKKNESRYTKFKAFMQDKKNDPDQLEIASSICYLRNEAGMVKNEVLCLTEGKRAHFTMSACERIWRELESYGVVKS